MNPLEMYRRLQMAEGRVAELETALEFYADPETYFAWGMFADSPAGDWDSDFEETHLGLKPGKRARAVLDKGEKEP